MAAKTMPDGAAVFASDIYQQYAQLLRSDPGGIGGQLLLAAEPAAGSVGPPDREIERLVRAANIAGAATLLVGAQDSLARERVRSGVCDFLVTTLDEALRILKNELRLKQSVAVCLLSDPAQVVRACIERGVQPDLLAALAFADWAAARDVLLSRGAVTIADLSPGIERRQDTAAGAQASVMSMAGWAAPSQSARAMPALDALVLQALTQSQQPERRRWLLRAPQYLGRVFGRGAHAIHTVPMLAAEATSLLGTLSPAVHAGQLPPDVQVQFGDVVLSIERMPAEQLR